MSRYVYKRVEGLVRCESMAEALFECQMRGREFSWVEDYGHWAGDDPTEGAGWAENH